MHVTIKITYSLSSQYTEKQGSNYTSFYSPAHGEFENLCFDSVAPMVCVLRAFVYSVVDVNMVVVIFSSIPICTSY